MNEIKIEKIENVDSFNLKNKLSKINWESIKDLKPGYYFKIFLNFDFKFRKKENPRILENTRVFIIKRVQQLLDENYKGEHGVLKVTIKGQYIYVYFLEQRSDDLLFDYEDQGFRMFKIESDVISPKIDPQILDIWEVNQEKVIFYDDQFDTLKKRQIYKSKFITSITNFAKKRGKNMIFISAINNQQGSFIIKRIM